MPALWSLRPNNLLIWVAMQWGIAHGCEQFHFGRSDADNQGLRAFKSAWGAEESPLAYSTVGSTGGGSLPHVPGLGEVVERHPLFAPGRVPAAGRGALPLRGLTFGQGVE